MVLRAVGQRRHGLGAADGEHAVHAGNARGSEHDVVTLAARGQDDHDDFAHASHLGRDGVHQHRRG